MLRWPEFLQKAAAGSLAQPRKTVNPTASMARGIAGSTKGYPIENKLFVLDIYDEQAGARVSPFECVANSIRVVSFRPIELTLVVRDTVNILIRTQRYSTVHPPAFGPRRSVHRCEFSTGNTKSKNDIALERLHWAIVETTVSIDFRIFLGRET